MPKEERDKLMEEANRVSYYTVPKMHIVSIS